MDKKLIRKVALESILEAWDHSDIHFVEFLADNEYSNYTYKNAPNSPEDVDEEDYEALIDEVYNLRDLFLKAIGEGDLENV